MPAPTMPSCKQRARFLLPHAARGNVVLPTAARPPPRRRPPVTVAAARPPPPRRAPTTTTTTTAATRRPPVAFAAKAPASKWDATPSALTAYSVALLTLALGAIPGASDALGGRSYVPYFLSIATVTIFIGSHRSLSNRQLQGLTLKQSAFAPVAASVSLFGIYTILKNLNVDVVALLIGGYFGLITLFSVSGVVRTPLAAAMQRSGVPDATLWTAPEDWFEEERGAGDEEELRVCVSDTIALAIGLAVAVADASTNHRIPWLSNFSAMCVAAELLSGISLGSYWTAAALLSGLLVYDVFWVFFSPRAVGENVMVVVATSKVISGPTRLLFPRPTAVADAAAASGSGSIMDYTLLGLGDVLVPGLMVALALRADAARKARWGSFADGVEALREEDASWFASRPLFTAALGGYGVGLGMAFVANGVFKAAQPALLYLSPCVLLATLGCAAARGEVGDFLAWRDGSRDDGSR